MQLGQFLFIPKAEIFGKTYIIPIGPFGIFNIYCEGGYISGNYILYFVYIECLYGS